MLNIYLIYISSIETGDVTIYPKVYSNFGRATNDIDLVIKSYVENKQLTDNYVIIPKDNFDEKKIRKESNTGEGYYYFKKMKSSVSIYKKEIIEGRLWNGSKLVKVGKIGISTEINIPVDDKLIRLVNSNKHENNITTDSDLSEDDNYQAIPVTNPSNYDHGNHASFIHEIKLALATRRNSILNIEENIKKNKIDNSHEKEDQGNLLNILASMKEKLSHVTPPPSPDFGMGRIVSQSNSEFNSQSNDKYKNNVPDLPYDIPQIPEIPPFPDILRNTNDDDEWSSEDNTLLSTYNYEPKPYSKQISIKGVVKMDTNYSEEAEESTISSSECTTYAESDIKSDISIKVYDPCNGTWNEYHYDMSNSIADSYCDSDTEILCNSDDDFEDLEKNSTDEIDTIINDIMSSINVNNIDDEIQYLLRK